MVEIELAADGLDSRGMVCDFSDVNRVVKDWIDRELDHKMILCKSDPLIKVLGEYEQPIYFLEENPTAENLARIIYEFVKSQDFPVIEVRLWETPNSFASYRE
jgi:6-pyruvoyltetrahydropterin/6-carboxytetrahydropterin synthase